MFPTSLNEIKSSLKRKGATKFRTVKRNLAVIDGTLVIITRFKYLMKNKQMYGAWEPETGFFETDKKPIGKIT